MKQKIVIRAIIKDQQGRILLLRRKGGRESIAGKFELPGGKMIAGEQPDDTLKRVIKYHTSLIIKSKQLFDVVSYIDPDDRQTQYLFIIYLVGLSSSSAKIILDSGYDKYIWKTKSNIQHDVVTNSTMMLLGLGITGDGGKYSTNKGTFYIYTDGASRGNPGQAAAGYIILDQGGDPVVEGGRVLGNYDSVFAEYAAMLLGLQKAKKLGLDKIEFRSDSLSVVNQINGIYEVTLPDVIPLYERIMELKKEFKAIHFVHVRRKFNQMADGLANKMLDQLEIK